MSKRVSNKFLEEISWSLLLFKDYVTAHGDDLLLQLLSSSSVKIAKHYKFTRQFKSLNNTFLTNQRVLSTNNYLWRVETRLDKDDGAHHFILFVDNTNKKISILDPAISENEEDDLYSIPSDINQVIKLANTYGYAYELIRPPSACQPSEDDYLDTYCQIWSILLGISHVSNIIDFDRFQFKSTSVSELKARINILFEGIQIIYNMIPPYDPTETNKYKIFDSPNSTTMIAFDKPESVKKHYTDKLILKRIQFLLDNPEYQYIAVRDKPFPITRLTRQSSKASKHF